MVVAQEAFEQLMNHATEGNPKDKPIKVPLMPKLDLGLLDIGTGVFAERMSSMQTRLNKHLSMTDGEPQCADAHDSALALFHKGARQHEEIKQFFDAGKPSIVCLFSFQKKKTRLIFLIFYFKLFRTIGACCFQRTISKCIT